jgi:alkylation response protein AidB-like acyl-CoA dehydrogenase
MDVIGPDREPVPSASAVIDEVIAPLANDIDEIGVPRSSIDALAAAGLLGSPLPTPQQRELGERLAMADASTWFCWVQHQSPLRALEDAPESSVPRQRWLDGLRSGQLLGAVAFAHVRRPGPANPVAHRVDGGWRIDGMLDWVTSWDIADVLMILVKDADADAYLTCVIPGGRGSHVRPGMSVHEPLRLLAMSGTHTRPIGFDGVLIAEDEVTATVPVSAWHRADDIRTKDANPAAFGLVRGAVAELVGMEHAELQPTIDALSGECRAIRAAAYALADVADEGNGAERLRLRAASLDLAARAATAVIIARSGAAMRRGHSAERRIREAMFLQVQAQTVQSRAAGLALVTRDR